MYVFVCAGCGAELTVPLSRVPLPAHAHQRYGNGVQLPALMEPGTFAVEPDHWGPPWRPWDEAGPAEAAARGIHAPVHTLSDGARGAIVTAPGDIRGTRLTPDRCGGACCGLDGGDGPNLSCVACGLAVASRIDDCSLWQAVWLAPDAVRRVRVDGAAPPPLTWEELVAEGKRTPLFEPIVTWGASLGTGHYWSWSPRWEAAAGQALAHLLAASVGRPVTVADGLVADVFRRTLDALLPAGGPPRHAVLAGPGRPAPETDADIHIVPVHPRTGRIWTPPGPAAAPARPVPLPMGVWLSMSSPRPGPPVPATGGMPRDVLRDDPLPPRPHSLFRVDSGTFRHTVVRLPAARHPWLREILENRTRHRAAGLFQPSGTTPLRRPFRAPRRAGRPRGRGRPARRSS
ncbi:hypothetical protein [Streptomyces sp. SID10815]|uniref:hypothetical protein n=1 Tax=Streptomyces sp. SID10815 TaxID=2706027 RepID=UPI0031BB7A73